MEKQTLFMLAVTGGAVVGSLGWGPYVGLFVYFVFAVLRPQSIWMYALPRDWQWSLYAAAAALAATALYRLRVVAYPTAGPSAGARAVPWNPIHWLTLAFFGWMTVCYLTAENQAEAWRVYDIYLKTAVMFAAAALTVHRLSQLWLLLAGLAVADVYVGYEANHAYFVWGWNQIQKWGFGGLDNNGAALMLAMGVPLCYFLWEGTKGWWRWGYLLAVPVLAHAVQLTFSRGAMLASLLALPAVFLLSRHKGLLAVFGLFGAAFVVGTSGPELRERFFSIDQHEVDASANMRKMAWQAAVEIAAEHPVVGVGPRCSAPHMKEHGAPENMAIHSQYLQLAADTGWVGMGVYVALLATVLVYGVRLWWALRRWPDHPEVRRARALAAGVVTALVLYAVGTVFLSMDTFELPYILALLMAQLWNCYKGGGIEAAVRASGLTVPPPRWRPVAAPMPPPRPPVEPPVPLSPAGPA